VSLYARIASSSFLADYGRTFFGRSDFYWVTNFPRGPRGLPLAIYLFVGCCGSGTQKEHASQPPEVCFMILMHGSFCDGCSLFSFSSEGVLCAR
jgi:hypothetical protein